MPLSRYTGQYRHQIWVTFKGRYKQVVKRNQLWATNWNWASIAGPFRRALFPLFNRILIATLIFNPTGIDLSSVAWLAGTERSVFPQNARPQF